MICGAAADCEPHSFDGNEIESYGKMSKDSGRPSAWSHTNKSNPKTLNNPDCTEMENGMKMKERRHQQNCYVIVTSKRFNDEQLYKRSFTRRQ
jgi:hypothetical protein